MKRLFSFILVVLLVCTVACGCSPYAPVSHSSDATQLNYESAGLKVHFINVGQGDSILVESFGKFALIDGGEYSEKDKVISYLSEQGVSTLDYIFCTHPHSDHCGGLSEVIRNYTPSLFISPVADSDSDAWNYTLDAADERNVIYETPDFNSVYEVGGATITVLSPSIDALYRQLNDYSIVCMVEYLGTRILLTGDAEALVEDELIRKGVNLSADILKCGHHGSSSSSSEDFLNAVSPSAAIISCGKGNKYGHPHDETLDAFAKSKTPVFRTDVDGSITITCDGELIEVSSTSGTTTQFKPKQPSSPTTTQASSSVDTTQTASTAAQPTTVKAVTGSYIGNKNSKVFHYADCTSVDVMNNENKVEITSRDSAISQGYKPCSNCNP